jgi:hypothetical protein
MSNEREIKQVSELKSLSRSLMAKLFLTINGSVHTYLAVTQDVPSDEKKQEIWEKYNELFNEKILCPVLDIFDKNRCGVSEFCTAVLKLLEIAGSCVSEVEHVCDKEAKTIKYWEQKFANNK